MYQNGDKIDADKLIQAVRGLAAERPDFVYPANPLDNAGPACYYTTEDGTPDCIIGCAMDRIGQPLPAQDRVGFNECKLLDDAVYSTPWERALDTSLEKFRWLSRVQQSQDAGYSWSEAVRQADENN